MKEVQDTGGNVVADIRSAILWLVLAAIALSFALCSPALLLRRSVMGRIMRFHIRAGLGAARLICDLSWEVRGDLAQCTGPVLVAAKHQSSWETFALQLILNDPAVVLKKELLRIPFYGFALMKMGHLAIDRRGELEDIRDVLDKARTRLNDNRQIVIFPEGTRRPPGAPPAYQSGAYLLYRFLGVDCVPVALNSGRFWPTTGFRVRPGRIVLTFLPRIPPGLTRSAFTDRLVAEIESETARL